VAALTGLMILAQLSVQALPKAAFAGGRIASAQLVEVADPNPPVKPEGLSIPGTPIVAGSPVGYLASSGMVTPGGQYSYSVPLDVPAGREGMAPSLALTYSSGGGNGPVGVGWNVHGSWSVILRCGKSKVTDGYQSGVMFDKAKDRFCLDGQELVAVGNEQGASGGYGDSGTEYRTESDTFAQIWSVGSDQTIASGPDEFVVLTKDAKTLRFKPRTATRQVTGMRDASVPTTDVQSSSTVRSLWLLETVTDRSGNEIRYEYQDFSDASGVEFQPKQITYTWGAGGVEGKRRVEFDYRTDRPDVSVVYQAGVAYKSSARVQYIYMYAPNPASTALVWRYVLGYTVSNSGRSMLDSVAKCSPGGVCLKPKRFVYHNPARVQSPASVVKSIANVTQVGGDGSLSHGLNVTDLDGNGKDDIVYGNSVRLSTAHALDYYDTTLGSDPAAIAKGSSRTVDVDSDGKFEYMAQNTQNNVTTDSVTGWDSASTQFTALAGLGSGVKPDMSNFGDVDGDGLMDYFSVNASNTQVILRRQVTGGWGPQITVNFSAEDRCPSAVTDVDGDGRAELLLYKDRQTDPLVYFSCNDSELYALSYDGTSFTAQPRFYTSAGSNVRTAYAPKGPESWMASTNEERIDNVRGDFNGDGLIDFLDRQNRDKSHNMPGQYDVIVWNTGAGLRRDTDHAVSTHRLADLTQPWHPTLNPTVPDGHSYYAADMTDDGRDDIIEVGDGIWVYASNGDGTFANGALFGAAGVDCDPSCGNPLTKLGDFNGDGRTDLVAFYADSIDVLAQGYRFPDFLIEVRDEDVAEAKWRESITYGTSWTDHPENMPDYTCTYPQVCLRRGMPVVRQVSSRTRSANVTAPANFADEYRYLYYTYEDPVADVRGGGGFLGFGTVRVWDTNRPIETISTYAHRKLVDGKFYPEISVPATVTTAVPIVTELKGGTTTETARITRTHATYTTVKTHDLNGVATYTVRPTSSYTNEWEEPVTVVWALGLTSSDPAEHVSGISEPESPLRTARHSAQFDAYDNITQTIEEVANSDIALVTNQVDTTFDNRLQNEDHTGTDYLVGLPLKMTVKSTDTSHGVKTTTRVTDFTHDALGRLEKVEVEKAGAVDLRQTTTFGYDNLGVQTSVSVAAGDPSAPSLPKQETHTEYDPVFSGQPDEEIYPSQVWVQHVPANKRTSTWFATHPAYGVTVATMDANGVQSSGTFDTFGRPMTATADGGASTTFSYADRPDSYAGGANGVITTATTAGITTKVYTDLLGRSMKSTMTGFDGATNTVSLLEYDKFGRVTQSTGAAPAGTTTNAYDSLNRLVSTTLPDSKMINYTHTFNTTKTVGIKPSTTGTASENTVTYDVAGRAISSADLWMNGSAPTQITTTYEYGPFGLTNKVIDGRGNTTSMVYDTLGRQTSITEPDRGTTTTTYFGTGQVRTATSATGVTSTYAYDDMARNTSRIDNVAGNNLTTSFVFDTAINGIGKMASATSPDSVTTAMRYDTNGRVAGSDINDALNTFSFDNSYDSTGRLSTIQYPNSGNGRLTLRNDYNTNGYLNKVGYTQPGNSSLLNLYTVNSRLANMARDTATLNNGATIVNTYTASTARPYTQTTMKGATKLQDLTYDYYDNGLVKKRTDNANLVNGFARTDDFTYDTVGRLTNWILNSGGSTNHTTYTYDTIGNLTGIDRTFASTGAPLDETRTYGKTVNGVLTQPHTLTGVTPTCPEGQACVNENPQYDPKGRQTSGNGRTVTYTAFDLPKTVTRNGQTTTFKYDAFGQRFKEITGVNTTYTVGGIYEKRSTSTSIKHIHHINGPDGPIAQIVVNGANIDTQYHLTDTLGSINTTLNTAGTSTGSFYFDPFGARINHNGTLFTGATGDTNHGFTGQEHDDELDLINMKGRVYDPNHKQFLTADPLNNLGADPYSYVNNSPVNYTDPTGYRAESGGGLYGTGIHGSGMFNAGGGWTADSAGDSYLFIDGVLGFFASDHPGLAEALTNISSGRHTVALRGSDAAGLIHEAHHAGDVDGTPTATDSKPAVAEDANSAEVAGWSKEVWLGAAILSAVAIVALTSGAAAPVLVGVGTEISLGAAAGDMLPIYLMAMVLSSAIEDAPPTVRTPDERVPLILYHYTTEKNMMRIVASQTIYPSILVGSSGNSLEFGNGVYLTDLPPGIFTKQELAEMFFGSTGESPKVGYFVGINVQDMQVEYQGNSIYRIPTNAPVSVAGRITGFGPNPGRLPPGGGNVIINSICTPKGCF
jgi:RHS repeat-associated protein